MHRVEQRGRQSHGKPVSAFDILRRGRGRIGALGRFQVAGIGLHPAIGLGRRLAQARGHAECGADPVHQGLGRARLRKRLAETMALGGHEPGEGLRPGGPGKVEQGRDRARDLPARIGRRPSIQPRQTGALQCARFGLVLSLEARRQAGLQRELPQQAFAIGVQRLDFQPARRLERAGKQAPGAREPVAVAGHGGLEAFQLGREGRVREGRPFAQFLEETGLHLSRRGLGEGHAEYALRLGALQQQPCDAVDQNARLARSGIGFDEDADIRRCRGALRVAGRLHYGRIETGCAHPPAPSSPASGALAHSLRRARWSYSP